MRGIERLRAGYESAINIIAADDEGVFAVEERKLQDTEEHLRFKGFSDKLIQCEAVPVIDVVRFLNDQGAIGYAVATESHATRGPVTLTAPPAKALILFIHGLGGKRTVTWGRLPEYLAADVTIARRYQMDFYSYPTQLLRLPLFPRTPKIQVLADGLRTQIKYAGFDRINIVCHSLGGLVAKHYLLEEAEAKRELRVDRLALIAVPNNGADLASTAQLVSFRNLQLRQLCRDADIIELDNKAWHRLEMRRRMRVKYVIGSQDRVVSRQSAEEFWGNPDVETIVGAGHIDIVKPGQPDALLVRMMREFLIK
jgi:pimeloyl-ACP methyl ester carboxylesterase